MLKLKKFFFYKKRCLVSLYFAFSDYKLHETGFFSLQKIIV